MPAPGPRGGAKARGRKPTRGGGKHFSTNLGRNEDGSSMWAMREPEEKDDSSEEEEESEEEESDNERPVPKGGSASGNVTLSREERRAAAKARREEAARRAAGKTAEESEEEEEVLKQIPVTARAAGALNKPLSADDDGRMSRKEREAAEAAAAKERYRKLHEAGKTVEAQADLARLKIIREERERAKQRRLELEEERKREMEEKLNERKPNTTAKKPAKKK